VRERFRNAELRAFWFPHQPVGPRHGAGRDVFGREPVQPARRRDRVGDGVGEDSFCSRDRAQGRGPSAHGRPRVPVSRNGVARGEPTPQDELLFGREPGPVAVRGLLHLDGAAHGGDDGVERDHEAVAPVLQLRTAMLLDRLAQDVEQCGVDRPGGPVAERVDQVRRPDLIDAQQGQRAQITDGRFADRLHVRELERENRFADALELE
jgi:hypothetical protein